jgi:hypothetical protein
VALPAWALQLVHVFVEVFVRGGLPWQVALSIAFGIATAIFLAAESLK